MYLTKSNMGVTSNIRVAKNKQGVPNEFRVALDHTRIPGNVVAHIVMVHMNHTQSWELQPRRRRTI